MLLKSENIPGMPAKQGSRVGSTTEFYIPSDKNRVKYEQGREVTTGMPMEQQSSVGSTTACRDSFC